MILTKSPMHSPRNSRKYLVPQQSVLIIISLLLGHLHGRFYAETVPRTAVSNLHRDNDESGWRRVDVFVGKTRFESDQRWYSQAAQDELVSGLLRGKQNGFFIDLAANDAQEKSNTYALERFHGWRGLCIEPNPAYWYNLTRFRTCATVGAVVGNQSMQEVYFRYEAGDHGGIADSGFDNGKRWQRHSDLAFTVPLRDVLERYDVPQTIDYLSLDVEGAESFVMLQFPLSRYRIKLITAERLRGEIRQYLKDHGYQFAQKLTRWGESLWVHDSVRDTIDWSVIEKLDFPRD